MHKSFLLFGSLFGAAGIALGAFGAHGLERVTQDEKILHSFQTGVQYQVYHALALLIVGFLSERMKGAAIKWAGRFMITGVLLFSGSLYLLTFLKINESAAVKFAGPVTPLGGLFFILGWCSLFVAVMKYKGSEGKG